jgi:hypothetical protein
MLRLRQIVSATFSAYIDESGDEGFAFGRGSSEWFALAAIIVKKQIEPELLRLVGEIRQALGRPEKKPLHFRDLRHEHRLPLIHRISQTDMRIVALLVNKPSLKEPEKFQERYRLYFYAVRYVLERVSWYCRDHKSPHDCGDGSTDIIFSNRSGMSYDELRRYIGYLENNTGLFDVRIEWSVVKPDQIQAHTAGKRVGLQLADAVASSFFYAVEASRLGFTESRYAEMLRPVVYQRNGRRLGYGLKFWPRDVDELIRSDDRFRWARGW